MFRFNTGLPIGDDGCHRTGRWRYQVVMLCFFVLLMKKSSTTESSKTFWGVLLRPLVWTMLTIPYLLFWHYISNFREGHDSTIGSAVSTIPLEITATQ